MHAGKSIIAENISAVKDDKYCFPCIGGNGIRGYTAISNTKGTFPIIGRQGALCGNINYAEGEFYATEHAVVVDTFCETNTRWAYYFLIQLDLNQYATATAQPGLSVKTISDVQIPVPPKEEQERIVIEIENLLALIDELDANSKNLLEATQQAKSKILELAIHGKLVSQDPNDEPASELLKRIAPNAIPCDTSHYRNLPMNWCECKLGDIVDVISGVAYNKSDIQEKGLKILRGGNIQEGKIIEQEDDVYISETYSNEANSVKCGDIVLVASTGSQTLIGKTGFAKRNYTNTQIGAFLRIIRAKDKRICEYLNFIFNSESFRRHIRRLASGTNINNIKNQYITEYVFALPPIKEIEKIVKSVDQLNSLVDNIISYL